MASAFTIDRYLNIRSALAPTFSPDGRFVAFLTNITGVSQLWQVPVEGGWPTQLTFTSESVRMVSSNPGEDIRDGSAGKWRKHRAAAAVTIVR